MTPAGTVVSNVATAIYSGGSVSSNAVQFTVLQVAGVASVASQRAASGSQGAAIYYPITVTNTGNGPDSFTFSLSSQQGWPCAVYLDANGDGIHQVTETTLATSTGSVAAGASAKYFATVTVPATAIAGDAEVLTVTSKFSSTASARLDFITTPIVIAPLAPVSDFSASPLTGTAPLTVSFTDQSTGSPTAWSWSFGDGSTASERNPTHQYTAAGTYTVSLTATNASGSSTKTRTAYIAVTAPPPVAGFVGAPLTGTAPLTVTFTDQSTGSPTAWSWSFGDGSTASERNPTHQYTAAGAYTVSLTATNASGSSAKTRTAYIAVTAPPPVAGFVGAPLTGTAPLTVSFTDQSTGSPTAWSWSFGDGSTASERNPTHQYTAAGAYTVSLTATNASGSSTKTKTAYIAVTAPASPPVAGFVGAPLTGTAPLTVSFTDQSTGSPTAWSWSFGDGSTASERNPTHQYAAAGSYTVTLTVTNADGTNTKAAPGYVVVTAPNPLPVVDFDGVPLSGRIPLTVAFTDLSTNVDASTTWSWNFGDGQRSTIRNPAHQYGKQGLYTVSLTVTNALRAATVAKYNYIQVRRGKVWPYPKRTVTRSLADVPVGYWARDEILALNAAGLVMGYPDGRYHPNWQVGRDQLAVFISRALAGGDSAVPDAGPTPTFADVPTDFWAYKYVEFAASKGVVRGYPDKLYHPSEPVSRGQMAVVLARSIADPVGEGGLAGYTPPATPTFSDVTPDGDSAWCYRYVEYLASEGMVAGYSDDTYRPQLIVTRDQLAVYIARAFGLVE